MISANASPKVKTAILMMNMGGPSNSTQVFSFLNRLFSDADLIPLGPFQRFLGPFIARRRTSKIQDQYNKIGGGSPIGIWTRKQADLMVERLDVASPLTAPHKAYIGFRYADPLTCDALDEIISDGAERAVAFTQYPQYSCSTTGSSLNQLAKHLQSLETSKNIKWSLIDRWPTHSGLVNAFASLITEKLSTYPESARSKVILLFSAHSLPMSVVNRGDPYPQEVGATVQAVMTKLGFSNPYRLVWQSQVGPSPWLGPRTDLALKGLAEAGHKNIMMVPIAFTSDHIETLFELDQEYTEDAEKLGITGLTRCESLNVNSVFVSALSDIVKSHLETDEKHSKQWPLRCPGCDKDSCKNARAVFK